MIPFTTRTRQWRRPAGGNPTRRRCSRRALSRRLHLFLNLGILSLLAGPVTFCNFLRNNPHARDIE